MHLHTHSYIVSINLKVIADFSEKLLRTNVVIKIPVLKNMAKLKVKVSFSQAKYEPEQHAVMW